MTKRIAPQLAKFKYQGEPLKLTLGTLVLAGLCSFLIVIATFTQFSFDHFIIPSDFLSYIDADFSKPEIFKHFMKHYRFIPQIPVILFIAGLLGRRFGILSVSIYIIIGLFFYPIFAVGGGFRYVLEYGFGYILAYIPAVFFAGSIIKSGLTYRNMGQAAFVGVLTIHLIGILYMLFIATIQRESSTLILGWVLTQSGVKILYDLVFSFLAMVCAKYVKKFLWVTMN